MQTELTLPEKEAVHDLVNLRLYPSPHLQLGQIYRLNFAGATVRIERTGAPFRCNFRSLHYHYLIEGSGFELALSANYPDEGAATAFVEVLSVSPVINDADNAFLAWLNKLLRERRGPSDPLFDEFLLQ